MHSYSTDVSRLKIISKIGTASFLASILLINFFDTIIQKIIMWIPYLDKTPYISSLAIFGCIFALFYFLFDKVLWNVTVKGISVSKTPDLTGEWKGYVVSKCEGKTTKTDVTVEIEQTWTSISITLKTTASRSRSAAASIFTSESQLVYYYFNVPRSTTVESMHKHYGVTTLNIIGNSKLEGEYFNCPDRGTYGDIFIEKVQKVH
ncbi:hypothetical protein [Methanosarcina sp. MTP4]|uniref:Cap15 family cyclic dinucleotide receptor domain-containing protein n=1 Tax=Methanosarcina sp. MTP4 TaxID=1434100 RepID=UPI00064E3BF2|nr:hypothetical protein [Methanosarcina sp. MTP4]